jgi:hypothetical protein
VVPFDILCFTFAFLSISVSHFNSKKQEARTSQEAARSTACGVRRAACGVQLSALLMGLVVDRVFRSGTSLVYSGFF